MIIAGKQDLKCSEEWQFWSLFYAFGIKEGMQTLFEGGRNQGGDWIVG